jgi:hypothetical protein
MASMSPRVQALSLEYTLPALDGPTRTALEARLEAAAAVSACRAGYPRRPCESVHKTFPRKRRLLANSGSDGATHRAGASPRQMISIARSSVTGAAGMVAAA